MIEASKFHTSHITPKMAVLSKICGPAKMIFDASLEMTKALFSPVVDPYDIGVCGDEVGGLFRPATDDFGMFMQLMIPHPDIDGMLS
jgi:hypothetical protein